MASWVNGPMLGFDTETTGVDPSTDRILTAALVHQDADGNRKVRTWLINPGVDIPASSTEIHGITNEQVQADGVDPAQALEEIASIIVKAQRAGMPVVAYNASFDLAILECELARHGLPTVTERLGHTPFPVIDPLVIDRHCVKYRRGRRRLGDLLGYYGLAEGRDLHAADVDVAATLDILAAQVAAFPAIDTVTPQRLHEAQVEAYREWAVGYSQWCDEKGLDVPRADLMWPLPSWYLQRRQAAESPVAS